MRNIKLEVSKDEYLQLADKYDTNQEVMKLVVVTHHAAKQIYLVKGFVLGVTCGMAVALIVACIAWFVNLFN